MDPDIHAIPRLRMLGMLCETGETAFTDLRDGLGLSDASLSKHSAALADAGYVDIRKATTLGRRRTWLSITRPGRERLRRHVDALLTMARGHLEA